MLPDKDNQRQTDILRPMAPSRAHTATVEAVSPLGIPFLRIPPFPKAAARRFTSLGHSAPPDAAVIDALRHHRVGGSYWAAQPKLPAKQVVVRAPGARSAAQAMAGELPVTFWFADASPAPVSAIIGDCDPWHMLKNATALICEADDETRLVAALLGLPRYLWTNGKLTVDDAEAASLLAAAGFSNAFENPFTGDEIDGLAAINLCGFWRRLIDENRDVSGGLGFAFWKQEHIAPLLWDGSRPFRFFNRAVGIEPSKAVAVWRAKAPGPALAALQATGTPLIEVEDGFLRSRGLGADCIPPLSITVDRLGPHFDPAMPSELELLLQEGEFADDVLSRARDLRRIIVDAGLGKYAQGGEEIPRPAGSRRHVLVPGQVEDDRAVQSGGCGLTCNLELLKRVRAQTPDAYILYKPHPDVVAGHRRGAIPDHLCLRYADRIVGDVPVNSLLNMADEVHVNTSLAGFEALLREKSVVTYGVPFYAGWGLTRDLGPVPQRRRARRSLDELVAATLLIYPRYLDPVTGLPCPAEVLVSRLSQNDGRDASLLVGMRRLQGKFMRRLRSLVQ